MDFRHYLSESLQLSHETIEGFCSCPLGAEKDRLELIAMVVMHRPDGIPKILPLT